MSINHKNNSPLDLNYKTLIFRSLLPPGYAYASLLESIVVFVDWWQQVKTNENMSSRSTFLVETTSIYRIQTGAPNFSYSTYRKPPNLGNKAFSSGRTDPYLYLWEVIDPLAYIPLPLSGQV